MRYRNGLPVNNAGKNILLAGFNPAGSAAKLPFPVLALCLLLLVPGCALFGPEKKSTEEEIAEQFGIEITSIRMTAAGYMVDFRYRVLDPGKAADLFERQTKPYLIDQASGKVLSVPTTAKVGPLRTSDNPQQGRIYWMFFGNTRGLVQSGSKVTVVIGDFRMEDLVVQ